VNGQDEFTVVEPPFFRVNITDTTDGPVRAGEDVTVDYTVENTGGLADEQTIRFLVNGSENDTASVSLGGGASSSGQFTYATNDGDIPAINATVASENDSAERTVQVRQAVFDVNITGTNSSVAEGQTLTVDVNVTNTGDLQGTQTLNLTDSGFNDTKRDAVDVTLDAGESNTTVTLNWTTSNGDAGNGTVTVSSEDGNDTALVTVNSALNNESVVVYEGLTAVEGDGGRTTKLAPSGVSAVGPPDADLDGDGLTELPYVDGDGNLRYTNATDATTELVSSSAAESPGTTATILATGTWNGSEPSVFYANEDSDTIYRVTADGTVTKFNEPGNGAQGVIGTGDIDGDGSKELLFVDGSQSIRYIDDDGTSTNLQNANAGSNSGGIGAGAVVTLNGTTWVVFVDGSNQVALATNDGGNQKQTVTAGAAKFSPTAADVDGDGTVELVYVESGTQAVRYVNDPLGTLPSTEYLNDADGSIITTNQLGTVS